MKNPRREKINELKTAIKTGLEELESLRAVMLHEANQDQKKEHQSSVMVKKTLIQNMQQELKMIRMNKNSSKFFEFIPSPPNRSQARHFRKNRNARNTKSL